MLPNVTVAKREEPAMTEVKYTFKFTFHSAIEGRTIEHKMDATFEDARIYWESLLDIARATQSSAHKAWYQGQFGGRWHRWK